MVDLKSQYDEIRTEVLANIEEVLESSAFIKGDKLSQFEDQLSSYLNIAHVIGCANGTDAIQIALMALDLKPGDEVITPAFSYIAAAEVLLVMGLKPVLCDVDLNTFEMKYDQLESLITDKTKAIIAVHLFGQCNNIDRLIDISDRHGLILVEDNAQSIGSYYKSNTREGYAGSFGHIATSSFFPSKNLGAYGDGGAVMCQDETLANKTRMISSHGQSVKYVHDLLGINSRLDNLQAAVLNVKLKYLDKYREARQRAASLYDDKLKDIKEITIPARSETSSHVFHQYTIRVKNDKRDELKAYLAQNGISSAIYYPMPIYRQKAYKSSFTLDFELTNTEILCKEVLSLPICSHISDNSIKFVVSHIKKFFNT